VILNVRWFRQILAGTAFLFGVLALCLIFSGRTTSPTSGGSAANTTSATPSTLTIDITIAAGTVDPDREQIDVPVGQAVILNVKRDIDDELHAHMGLDGYALTVSASQRTTGGFRMRAPGIFVVESHHVGKTIVILNVRQV
jgi:hypothetical protein